VLEGTLLTRGATPVERTYLRDGVAHQYIGEITLPTVLDNRVSADEAARSKFFTEQRDMLAAEFSRRFCADMTQAMVQVPTISHRVVETLNGTTEEATHIKDSAYQLYCAGFAMLGKSGGFDHVMTLLGLHGLEPEYNVLLADSPSLIVHLRQRLAMSRQHVATAFGNHEWTEDGGVELMGCTRGVDPTPEASPWRRVVSESIFHPYIDEYGPDLRVPQLTTYDMVTDIPVLQLILASGMFDYIDASGNFTATDKLSLFGKSVIDPVGVLPSLTGAVYSLENYVKLSYMTADEFVREHHSKPSSRPTRTPLVLHGPKGDRGDRGADGAHGTHGKHGRDGGRGPRGSTGIRGQRGRRGYDGNDAVGVAKPDTDSETEEKEPDATGTAAPQGGPPAAMPAAPQGTSVTTDSPKRAPAAPIPTPAAKPKKPKADPLAKPAAPAVPPALPWFYLLDAKWLARETTAIRDGTLVVPKVFARKFDGYSGATVMYDDATHEFTVVNPEGWTFLRERMGGWGWEDAPRDETTSLTTVIKAEPGGGFWHHFRVALAYLNVAPPDHIKALRPQNKSCGNKNIRDFLGRTEPQEEVFVDGIVQSYG